MEVDIRRALEIPGWMEPFELEWLADQASRCARIIEIGSFRGRSTRAMADHTNGVIRVIDHWLPPADPRDLAADEIYQYGADALHEDWTRNLADHLASGRVVVTRAHSMKAAAILAREGEAPADLVFIDGDHSFIGCVSDILAYERFVQIGGTIAGHDYTTEVHPGVKAAVDLRFGTAVQQGPGSIWWVKL